MSDTIKSSDTILGAPPGDGICGSAREAILKDYADRFMSQLAHLDGLEFDIARIKIEEAVMWAVKGLTR
ncbi:hypothetical protein [uncultured Roseovarius sp.]|uniref:Acb2/Tad1 domain-containing protein n=1 Tax=uncultured Roseovarius sp. TaxID=293344 RepID=UPI0026158144|nr:hypothetical protein [uncultured Roseovarius sp.]